MFGCGIDSLETDCRWERRPAERGVLIAGRGNGSVTLRKGLCFQGVRVT